MYDPIDEVNYRYRLAINYLREANEAFSRVIGGAPLPPPSYPLKTRLRPS